MNRDMDDFIVIDRQAIKQRSVIDVWRKIDKQLVDDIIDLIGQACTPFAGGAWASALGHVAL